ncbi:MAG: hypothetical protein MdMp014T_1498 [Treponematales bacterium]
MKAGDTLSGIAQAAYGDMTLWGGVWEANKAKLPSAANPHNLPAGTVLSLPRFDTEAAKTSARNARHAAPAFTGSGSGAAAANARPVPYGEQGFEYLPVAFTNAQLKAMFVKQGGTAADWTDIASSLINTQYSYGGADWHIARYSGWGDGEDVGLTDAITAKNPELLRYALVYTGDGLDHLQGLVFYKGETVTFDKAPTGTVRYVLVRRAQ